MTQPWVSGKPALPATASLHSSFPQWGSIHTVWQNAYDAKRDVPVFLPSQITGLVAWFDASQISGIASGTSLSAWTDLSGQGNHVTNSLVTEQPIFLTNVQNGNSGISFISGNPLWLALPSTTTFTQPISICATAGYGTGASPTIIDSNNAGVACAIFKNAGTSYEVNAGSANDVTVSTTTFFHVHVALINGSTTTYRVDGNTNKNTGNAGTNNLGGLTIGQGRSHAGVNFGGFIGEIMIYNRNLVSTEVTSIENYLGARWGVAVT